MIESRVFVSTISLKLKTENGNIVPFNGLSITLRLSMKKV